MEVLESAVNERGFRIGGQSEGSLGAALVQLILPKGMSPEAARSIVSSLDRSATVDLDDYYYTDAIGREAAAMIEQTRAKAAELGPKAKRATLIVADIVEMPDVPSDAFALVLAMGGFGRTPRLSPRGGRDHWPGVWSVLFAGAGVRGGQVIGKSDKIGAYPITTPYSPDDLGATVYHVLGVDPEADVRDRLNRPVQLNRGQVMQCLFSGAAD